MTTASSGPTFRLIYRSHMRIRADKRKAELGAIFTSARSNNKKSDITGALLITDDWFAQALEGEESAVRSLFAHIERDPRHEHVTIVDASDVEGRVFSRWAMARVSEDGEPDIPLLANVNRGGAVPAAPRQNTPEQESVLAYMRDTVTGSEHPR